MADQPINHLDCRSPEGEAVAFIDAAIINLRMAERLFNNGKEYGDASKDFIRDPEVLRFIARCFSRGYHRGFFSPDKEQAFTRILRRSIEESHDGQ